MRTPCNACDKERLHLAETCWDHLPEPSSWIGRVLEDLRNGGGHAKNLAGAHFPGVDFRGVKLEFAMLTGADLGRARFDDVDLSRASLAGANLSGAVFNGAQLQMVNGRGARAPGADLIGAKLNGATFAGADFTDADFTRAELVGTNLRQAKLAGARFIAARFLRASLSGADLTHTDFTGADLRDVAMIDVQGLLTIVRTDATGNSPITTDVQIPGTQPPRPSEMRWRRWQDADLPPESPNGGIA